MRIPHGSDRAIALLLLAALLSCASSTTRLPEPIGAAASDITSEAPIVIGDPDPTEAADDSIPVKIERLPDLDYLQLRVTGILHPSTQVIRDSASWSKAWSDMHHIRRPRPPVPRVDFSRNRLLLVALGRRPVTGYAVEITGAYARSDTLFVGIRYVCFESRHGGSLPAESSPVDVVRVPRLDHDVVFSPRPAQACPGPEPEVRMSSRLRLTFTSLMAATLIACDQPTAPQAELPELLERRVNAPGAPYLVMYRGDTPNADELTSELERRYGFTSKYRFWIVKGFAAVLPDSVPEVLRAHPAVRHVEPDRGGSMGQTYERHGGSLGGESSPVDVARVPRLDDEVVVSPRPGQRCP